MALWGVQLKVATPITFKNFPSLKDLESLHNEKIQYTTNTFYQGGCNR